MIKIQIIYKITSKIIIQQLVKFLCYLHILLLKNKNLHYKNKELNNIHKFSFEIDQDYMYTLYLTLYTFYTVYYFIYHTLYCIDVYKRQTTSLSGAYNG